MKPEMLEVEECRYRREELVCDWNSHQDRRTFHDFCSAIKECINWIDRSEENQPGTNRPPALIFIHLWRFIYGSFKVTTRKRSPTRLTRMVLRLENVTPSSVGV